MVCKAEPAGPLWQDVIKEVNEYGHVRLVTGPTGKLPGHQLEMGNV